MVRYACEKSKNQNWTTLFKLAKQVEDYERVAMTQEKNLLEHIQLSLSKEATRFTANTRRSLTRRFYAVVVGDTDNKV